MLATRRAWLKTLLASSASSAAVAAAPGANAQPAERVPPLRITALRVTPIALPDPPILMANGCHGPYFFRTIVQLETDAGITGIGETRGGQRIADEFEKARPSIVGRNAFAYRALADTLKDFSPGLYAAIELACLDACGKATKRRLCELLGGPVREEVEFGAYLFYRYAADHPKLLEDPRMVDKRGRGREALDDWGEVLTPKAMVEEAVRFQKQFGFRVFKLKAGVLRPEVEAETMEAMQAQFQGKCPLRIDPNGKWTTKTAIAIGKRIASLNLEYYEDPVRGQQAMAEVRTATGLKMSTNMCVTRFEHIKEAVRLQPVDVVLADNHYWGGIHACQELGRICEALGWSMSQHSNNHAGVTMAAMTHVGAVCPQLTVASDTHYPWLVDRFDIIQGPKLPFREGKQRVPQGPGLGVALDLDRLALAAETYRKTSMRERDDTSTMRLIDPNWRYEPF
jgi:glucarate dehydratase